MEPKREYILKKIRMGVSKHVSKEFLKNMSFEIRKNKPFDGFLTELRFFLWGRKEKTEVVEHFSYPSDWWQAFKERWFPEFLREKFPVEYKYIDKTVHVYKVCPHLNIHPQQDHYRWLSGETDIYDARKK